MGDRPTGHVGAWLTLLERWVRVHPVVGSRGHEELGLELATFLTQSGLSVTCHTHANGDLIIARSLGAGPLVGIYNHFDVAPGGRTDLRIERNRVWGRGVGDNLGTLAMRLSVMARYGRQANLLWIIEPDEECGSLALADWLRESGTPRVGLWLDETGYFDVGGTQRLLALPAQGKQVDDILGCLAQRASAEGRETRVEERRLRRFATDGGVSVDELFGDAPYLAVGPNDDLSDVHGDHESLPLDTICVSMQQFEVLLDMASGDVNR